MVSVSGSIPWGAAREHDVDNQGTQQDQISDECLCKTNDVGNIIQAIGECPIDEQPYRRLPNATFTSRQGDFAKHDDGNGLDQEA